MSNERQGTDNGQRTTAYDSPLTADRSARGLVATITDALEDGDNEAAADHAATGLEAFPDAAVFHRLRGIALFALGTTDEARADLVVALAVDPLDNAAQIALAHVADAQGDPYTAAEDLLTAWEHDPANPDLRADLTARLATLYGPEGYLQFTRPALAALYARNAFPRRAEREYRAILAEHPDRTDLRLAYALARWRLGRLPETIEACSALLAEQPNLVRARWALVDALARRGNSEAAREHARAAARLDPDGAIARDLIAANPDATIVDPDESLTARSSRIAAAPRLRLVKSEPEIRQAGESEESASRTESAPLPPDSPTPAAGITEALSGLAAALTGMGAVVGSRESEVGQSASRNVGDVGGPSDDSRLPTPDSPTAAMTSLPNPQDTPYAEPTADSRQPTAPLDHDHEPEPVLAVVEEDGQIIATTPGGEPSLDATDVLPNPPIPFPTGEGGDVGAHSRAPSEDDIPTAVMSVSATADDPIAAMRARMAAGDHAGMVVGMRGLLAAAGEDAEQIRALLPALRLLVDALHRPDAHRLLGDAYRRLGLYPQAEGQYRQALLIRVAGKEAGK